MSGRLTESGAGSLLRLLGLQPILKRGVGNSSSPNTTGAILLNDAAGASNITSRTSLGGCGRPLPRNLKERLAGYMGETSERFCNGALTSRLWQTGLRSLFSREIKSHEFGRLRLGNRSPARRLDTLRWRMRILLSLGSLLEKDSGTAGLRNQRPSVRFCRRQLANSTRKSA